MNQTLTVRNTDQSEELATCATTFLRLRDEASSHLANAMQCIWKCGEQLIVAKSLCSHGTWGEWLKKHCHLNERQARRYMQVAHRIPLVEAKKYKSLRQALKDRSDLSNGNSKIGDGEAAVVTSEDERDSDELNLAPDEILVEQKEEREEQDDCREMQKGVNEHKTENDADADESSWLNVLLKRSRMVEKGLRALEQLEPIVLGEKELSRVEKKIADLKDEFYSTISDLQKKLKLVDESEHWLNDLLTQSRDTPHADEEPADALLVPKTVRYSS